jgi:hypothetical protein
MVSAPDGRPETPLGARRYDKVRDGVQIAENLHHPDAEPASGGDRSRRTICKADGAIFPLFARTNAA